MGAGIQTCRKLIDDGEIGKPIAATAFLTSHGLESRHPNPDFYYKTGVGPMLDMGPYYLTALINLIGPVTRITGSAKISFDKRIITSSPRFGQEIIVEVPTHITGVLDFASGAVGTIITSCDIWHTQLPRLEIYGTEGSLSVPDPNTFGGPVLIRRFDQNEWKEVTLSHEYSGNSRGIGLADMAIALQTGRKHRACGELAFHVLDIMQGVHEASEASRHYSPISTCDKPEAMLQGKLY
jgi:predicted dehydrogenase